MNQYAWNPGLARQAGPPPSAGPVPPYEPDPTITGEAFRRPPPTRPLTPDTSTHIYHPGQDHWYPSRRERPERLPVFTVPPRLPRGLRPVMGGPARGWDVQPRAVPGGRLIGREGHLTANAFPPQGGWAYGDWPSTYTPAEDVSPVPWPDHYDGRNYLIDGEW